MLATYYLRPVPHFPSILSACSIVSLYFASGNFLSECSPLTDFSSTKPYHILGKLTTPFFISVRIPKNSKVESSTRCLYISFSSSWRVRMVKRCPCLREIVFICQLDVDWCRPTFPFAWTLLKTHIVVNYGCSDL